MFEPMQGVTTALVAFIFFCVIFPKRIKSRAQFYAAFGLVCVIILLDALSYMIGGRGFRVFAYFAVAVLQVGDDLPAVPRRRRDHLARPRRRAEQRLRSHPPR